MYSQDYIIFPCSFLREEVTTLDEVALLIADPSPANCINMHCRLVCQDRNICLGKAAYLPGPAKPALLLRKAPWYKLRTLDRPNLQTLTVQIDDGPIDHL